MNKMHTDVDIIRLNEFSDFPSSFPYMLVCANDRISFDFVLKEKKVFMHVFKC